MKFTAVISSDTSETYLFYLPITVAAWRRVYGAPTRVLLVGDERKWSHGKAGLARQEATNFGAVCHRIDSLPGHLDSTVAQVGRLYAGLLPGVGDDELLVLSDTDMLPLRDSYITKDPGDSQLAFYNANAYSHERRFRSPMCHISGRAPVLRSVMQVGRDADLSERLQWQLDHGLGRNADTGSAWNYDELLFSCRFDEWERKAGPNVKINRQGDPPVGRLDRGSWGEVRDAHIEAHLPRDGHAPDTWRRVRPVLLFALGEGLGNWLDIYQKSFTLL